MSLRVPVSTVLTRINLFNQYYDYDTFIRTEQREPGLDLK